LKRLATFLNRDKAPKQSDESCDSHSSCDFMDDSNDGFNEDHDVEIMGDASVVPKMNHKNSK
jgi:hypothetical protein